MARPEKIGLDYFPLNVDFFEDDKLRFVEARFTEKGELIALKLLCKIYKAGYYIRWDEDMALLFSSTAGKNVTPGLANNVVNELVKRQFFDKALFERFAILTSNGIQKRYISICISAKRKGIVINKKYEVKEFPPEETALTPEETGLTPEEIAQRKEKERKEKEIKGESGMLPPPPSFKIFSEEDFKNEIFSFKEFSEEILTGFFQYWKEKSAAGKMKFQLEKTWETKLRLEKWKSNQIKFNQNGSSKTTFTGARQSADDAANRYTERLKKKFEDAIASGAEDL